MLPKLQQRGQWLILLSELVHGGNNSTNPGCFHFNPVRHATEVRSLNAALESERKELESARLEADCECCEVNSSRYLRDPNQCVWRCFYNLLQSFTYLYNPLQYIIWYMCFFSKSLSFFVLFLSEGCRVVASSMVCARLRGFKRTLEEHGQQQQSWRCKQHDAMLSDLRCFDMASVCRQSSRLRLPNTKNRWDGDCRTWVRNCRAKIGKTTWRWRIEKGTSSMDGCHALWQRLFLLSVFFLSTDSFEEFEKEKRHMKEQHKRGQLESSAEGHVSMEVNSPGVEQLLEEQAKEIVWVDFHVPLSKPYDNEICADLTSFFLILMFDHVPIMISVYLGSCRSCCSFLHKASLLQGFCNRK